MKGQTIRHLMMQLDPRLRFHVAGNLESVGAILKRRRIPGDCGSAIYGIFESHVGRICIGIAQDDASEIPTDEWESDQVAHPVMQSVDAVDILGNAIPPQDSIGE